MNASKLSTVERLAEELVARLTIELEASGRHVHLSRADVETLFGAGYRLNRTKDLSQPGQFACAERVTLEGPRGSLKNVVILGPERPESQVEISLTDAVALGAHPAGAPLRRYGGHPWPHPPPRGPGAPPEPRPDCGQAPHSHDAGRTPPASAWRTGSGCASSALPAARWCSRTWRCGYPPSFPRWCISTTTRPMRAAFRRATGA